MAAEQAKKPQSAYWLWLADNRQKITTMCGTGHAKVVGKKAGEMWSCLDAAAKAPYQKRAQEEKEKFDKFKATPEGQTALAAKKAEQKEKQLVKADRAGRVAAKNVPKDEALKKPPSAYFMWYGENRARVAEMLGTKRTGDIAKKCSEMWKTLPEAEKAPWEKKAKDKKDEYYKFVTSAEGAKKLGEFKAAQKAAIEKEKPRDVEPVGKKRPKDDEEEEEEEEDEEEAPPPPKRGRGRGRGRK